MTSCCDFTSHFALHAAPKIMLNVIVDVVARLLLVGLDAVNGRYGVLSSLPPPFLALLVFYQSAHTHNQIKII